MTDIGPTRRVVDVIPVDTPVMPAPTDPPLYSLPTPGSVSWWRQIPASTRLVVAAVSAVTAAAGAAVGTPAAAWAVFGAAGTVLAFVDLRTHKLPARLVYPLAAVIAAVLVLTAAVDSDWTRLVHAGLVTAAAAVFWVGVLLLAPTVIGIGDMRLMVLAAGLLGWTDWPHAVAGTLLTFVVGGVHGGLVLLMAGQRRVPLGPAIVIGALIASAIPGIGVT